MNKSFALERNSWYHITVQRDYYILIKEVWLKIIPGDNWRYNTKG